MQADNQLSITINYYDSKFSCIIKFKQQRNQSSQAQLFAKTASFNHYIQQHNDSLLFLHQFYKQRHQKKGGTLPYRVHQTKHLHNYKKFSLFLTINQPNLFQLSYQKPKIHYGAFKFQKNFILTDTFVLTFSFSDIFRFLPIFSNFIYTHSYQLIKNIIRIINCCFSMIFFIYLPISFQHFFGYINQFLLFTFIISFHI
ncbi:hypothetical protein ABPG72_005167 [Tetrahymena utriculariae]